MRNIKLTIAYDGTDYVGWQIQENGLSIQDIIQQKIQEMTGEENKLIGAGRTDAGVHALRQVASFRTEKNIPLSGFLMGLNSKLPPEIRIIKVEEVASDFHPIRDSKSKHYRYLISSRKEGHPLFLNRIWNTGNALDMAKMSEGFQLLVGEHDFSAFRASDSGEESSVKEIYEISIEETDSFSKHYFNNGEDKLYVIDIRGSGFLRYMVRNIVGTVVDLGREKISTGEFKEIFSSKDRKRAGVTAPAHGLYLMRVEY